MCMCACVCVEAKGWAVESRVYAEDPYRGFLPSIGPLVTYKEPTLKVNEGQSMCECVRHLSASSFNLMTLMNLLLLLPLLLLPLLIPLALQSRH